MLCQVIIKFQMILLELSDDWLTLASNIDKMSPITTKRTKYFSWSCSELGALSKHKQTLIFDKLYTFFGKNDFILV